MQHAFNPAAGTIIDLPAVIIVLIIAFLLTWGIRESAKVNAVMVLIKVAVVVLFIVVGICWIKSIIYIVGDYHYNSELFVLL